jgi:hypothetical protein
MAQPSPGGDPTILGVNCVYQEPSAATIARQLQAAIPDCDTQAAVYAQLVWATTEVAEYFGLTLEEL